MIIDAEVRAALDLLKSRANDFELHRINVLEQDLTAPPKVEQIDDNHQKFNGIIYRRDKSNHYQSTFHLHRAVYAYYYGEIPAGYVIHHIDHNTENNDITNLQLLTKSEHQKIHNPDGSPVAPPHSPKQFICEHCGKEYTAIDVGNNKYCPDCRPIVNNAKKKLQRYEKRIHTNICVVCGKPFQTKKPKSQTCSRRCQNRLHWQGHREIRTCPVCGKSFEAEKSNPKIYCSVDCANKHRTMNAAVFTKICPVCGETFSTKKRTQIYCSRRCSSRMKFNREIRTCPICGKQFEVRKSDEKICCSHICGGILAQKRR